MFFRGKYKAFSNFSAIGFIDEYGLRWKTAEHFYQAHKTNNQYLWLEVYGSPEGRDAKKFGSDLYKHGEQREDWNKIRNAIMLKALIFKFQQNPKAMKLLLSTQGLIEETNTWHDNYWGNCVCKKCENLPGKNTLGRFLMRLRDKFLLEIENALTVGSDST